MREPTSWIDPSPRIRLVGGLNRFGLKLFADLGRESQSESLILSLSSIAIALAMIHVGAAGETRRELATLLEYGQSDEQRSAAFRELTQILPPAGIVFRLVNRLWGQTEYHFVPDFLAAIERDLGGSLESIDFKSDVEGARQRINSWISQQTAELITEFIPPNSLNELTRLVVTNAVYFKGTWDHPFAKEATKEGDFHMAAGRVASVPFMHRTADFRYGETEELQLLSLPYQSQHPEIRTELERQIAESAHDHQRVRYGDFSMLILLPHGDTEVGDLLQLLVQGGLQCLPRSKRREVRVSLPAFRLCSTFSMHEVLQRIGLENAWSVEKANFAGMSHDPEGLFLGQVFHEALIDVNEEGTEAAAATAVLLVGGAALPDHPPVEFRANRPFLLMIRDGISGLIHFIGRYVGPGTS